MITLPSSNTELVKLLQYLVSIPSVNPAFATAGDDPSHFGEKRYSEVLAEELHQIGCQVWLEEVLTDRHNVMARLPGSVGNKSIALHSHLDTVQVTWSR
jgi:acetylornithine deacetylase/succinyl-diaminopimelate desuccinylase-like protein